MFSSAMKYSYPEELPSERDSETRADLDSSSAVDYSRQQSSSSSEEEDFNGEFTSNEEFLSGRGASYNKEGNNFIRQGPSF